MPVAGRAVRQPEVSQPSASPARPAARAQRVSSGGASSVVRRSGCPLASRQRWNGACSPHSGWVTLTCRQAPTHQSNARSSSPYSSAVREVKQMPVARAVAGGRERAGEREHRGDAGRVVERGAEPAVVVGADDDRPGASPGEEADDVVAGGARRDLRADGHRRLERTGGEPGAQRRGVMPADRHHRRRRRVPVAVERAQRAVGLEVGAAVGGGDDHPGGAAQAQLEADVGRAGGALGPVDEHERAAHVEPVELAPPRPAGVDEPARHAAPGVAGAPPERCALDRRPAAGHQLGAQEAPAVDLDLLDRDPAEPRRAQLARDVLGGRAVLRRAGDAEPERARAERGELVDDLAQVVRVQRQARALRPAGRGRSARRGASAVRASPGAPVPAIRPPNTERDPPGCAWSGIVSAHTLRHGASPTAANVCGWALTNQIASPGPSR